MVEVVNSDFNLQLRDKRAIVNNTLRKLLAQYVGIDNDLQAAIKYTLEAPGKRIRSALVLWCCEVVRNSIGLQRCGNNAAGVSGSVGSATGNRDAEVAAAAIEMVHTYSLVHDDLPAMDNDDLRRGQPTCHKAFDEATAILTGDALLTLAFEVLAEQISDPAIAVKLIRQLAHDAGPAGMIAGQMADLKAENNTGTKELIQFIHTNKTAKMFRCAAAMGAICGRANDAQLAALCEYGLKAGLGFQIADDILDASATSEHLGKTVGKDVKAGKVTYLSVMGMEKSRQLEKKLADEAVAALEPFGKEANILRQLAAALLQRTR